jgi:hypothetical protein
MLGEEDEMSSTQTVPIASDVEALDTAGLLAERVALRQCISLLVAEKARINGLIRAIESGRVAPMEGQEDSLRRQRRVVNQEITERSLALDRVKLRLFELQQPPRSETPRPAGSERTPATTLASRAERLAALEAGGPDVLLLRVQRAVGRIIDLLGSPEEIAEADRRTLGDLSFYLRQRFGSPAARAEALARLEGVREA